MPTLTSLSVLLKGDASSLVKATRTGIGALKDFGKVAGKGLAIGGAAGVAGLAAAAGGLAMLGNAARQSIDAHAKNASRLGLTVTEAQKLTLAAEQSDVKIRTLNTAMAILTREAGLAAGGADKSIDKFLELGLSMEQVNASSPFELLRLVVGKLGEASSAAERAAKANKLFGESYLKLNPLVDAGNQAFADANLIYEKLGLGIGKSGDDVQMFNDKLDTLGRLGVALRDKVFANLAPQLSQFAQSLVTVAAQFVEVNKGGERMAQTLAVTLSGAIKSVLGDLRFLFDVLRRIGQLFGFFVDLLKGLGTIQGGLVAAAGALFRGEGAGALSILSAIPGDAQAAFNGDNDEEQTLELEKQTRLLGELVQKEFGGAAFQ